MANTARRALVATAVVAVAAAIIAGGVWWLGGDEPAAVDAERAVSEDAAHPVSAEDDEERESAREGPPVAPEELTGTWVVDTSRPFDRAAGRGTFVGYRVDEELVGVGATTAVGRTPEVAGHLAFDRTRLTEVSIDADLGALVSDDGRRDRRIATMLGPNARASFELDDTIDLGEVPQVGEVIEVEVQGLLTIRETTRPVAVLIEAALTEAGMVVAGSTRITLADFSVSVPAANIVVSASDEAALEWQLYLRRR